MIQTGASRHRPIQDSVTPALEDPQDTGEATHRINIVTGGAMDVLDVLDGVVLVLNVDRCLVG